jgi:hypothetical protein
MEETGNFFMYFTQGVAATEVEVNTHTGDHTQVEKLINVTAWRALASKPILVGNWQEMEIIVRTWHPQV